MNVTKHTRAGYKGKTIKCPNCSAPAKVYHFAWSALGCQYCDAIVDKLEWQLNEK